MPIPLTVTAAFVSSPPSLRTSEGWATATVAELSWDFTNSRPVRDKTIIRILVDQGNLYVRFDAEQTEPIVATQTVDDVGEGSDDNVKMVLWPSGSAGLQYVFEANPRGTHYQSSTENNNYAPNWTSIGTVGPHSYEVTMRIPMSAIRGSGHDTWNVQFARYQQHAIEWDEWCHANGQSTLIDFSYSGKLAGLGSAADHARTRTRVGLYGLSQMPHGVVGSGLRAGMDLSVPLTATASFVGTYHPDYSNVERDQQTIAPTTFRRQYVETRPFFAQGAHFYDYSKCFGCPGASELYTPAIPTPKSGYQIEGTQGPITFGAFDAFGNMRNDDAESIGWTSTDQRVQTNLTRISVSTPFSRDRVDYGYLGWSDHDRWALYAEEAIEHGTTVTKPQQARRINVGIAYNPKDTLVSFSEEMVGAQYDPADGFVAVNDISGYSTEAKHTWRMRDGFVRAIMGDFYMERYAGSDGFGTNLFDASVSSAIYFRNRLSVLGSVGSSFYRLPGDPSLHPENQQVFRIDYNLLSATQSTIAWNGGRFGNGYLTAPIYQLSSRIARRFTATVYATETNWHGDGQAARQWLERASLTIDLGPRSSLTVGVRKIMGTAPPFPGLPKAPQITATNVSLAFAKRYRYLDAFVVYGDPSALVTTPTVILKIVRYVGADKGT